MKIKTAALLKKSDTIHWRSKDPSRLETFSDAVFAFAVTLVIVSLEVPKTFTELYETMKGALSFAACFAVLFNIWNNQNIFFRRYGLKDRQTVLLNAILLFVILLYVYPLKFLFSMMFNNNLSDEKGQLHEMIIDSQVPTLMLIYGAGITAINFLFFMLYSNAAKHRDELKLNAAEVYETDTIKYINLMTTFIGLIAMALALLLPVEYAGFSGFFYFANGIAYFFWFRYRHRKFNTSVGVNR